MLPFCESVGSNSRMRRKVAERFVVISRQHQRGGRTRRQAPHVFGLARHTLESDARTFVSFLRSREVAKRQAQLPDVVGHVEINRDSVDLHRRLVSLQRLPERFLCLLGLVLGLTFSAFILPIAAFETRDLGIPLQGVPVESQNLIDGLPRRISLRLVEINLGQAVQDEHVRAARVAPRESTVPIASLNCRAIV